MIVLQTCFFSQICKYSVNMNTENTLAVKKSELVGMLEVLLEQAKHNEIKEFRYAVDYFDESRESNIIKSL